MSAPAFEDEALVREVFYHPRRILLPFCGEEVASIHTKLHGWHVVDTIEVSRNSFPGCFRLLIGMAVIADAAIVASRLPLFFGFGSSRHLFLHVALHVGAAVADIAVKHVLASAFGLVAVTSRTVSASR